MTFKNLRTRVGKRVHQRNPSVYKSGAVESLLVKQLGKVGADFVIVLPVVNVLF